MNVADTQTTGTSNASATDSSKRKNIVHTIHTQLECLKYVGTKKDNTPTGEGIEVSIALLPDLVFDFRAYNLNAMPPRKVCAVGGRAGRIACALLHLQDEDDATYRVHLLTRTGNLGRLLLENEFTMPGSSRGMRHLDLDTVFLRYGQPRCALVAPSVDGVAGVEIDAQSADTEQELDLSCLHQQQSQRILKRAKTVCITSISTPHFSDLFREAGNVADPVNQFLFVDSTRPRKGNVTTLLKELSRRKEHHSSFAKTPLGIFVPHETECVIREAAEGKTIAELCVEFDVAAILYGNGSTIAYMPATGAPQTEIRCEVNFENEDIPERFKAGILLAQTLFRSLQDVRVAGQNKLHEYLLSQWPKSEWEWILQYGIALASAVPNHDGFCGLAELFSDNGNVEESLNGALNPHLPSGTPFRPLTNIARKAAGANYNEINLDGVLSADLARLAGHRRLKVEAVVKQRSEERDMCPELAVISGREQNPSAGISDGLQARRAAVLIDLDATLIDSTEQRKLALLPALRCLASALHAMSFPSLDQAAEFFGKHVYDPWPLYSFNLGIGDFRQTWNHQGWYAAFITLANNEELAKELLDHWKARDRSAKEREQARQIADQPWWRPWAARFSKLYQRTIHDHADVIRAARSVFEDVKLAPLKEARDLLRSLELTGAFSLYVVSEGDPETQWLKLKSTGLDSFFKRQCVLTTGDAAEPIEERTRLIEERGALEKASAEMSAKYAELDAKLGELGAIKERIQPWSKDSSEIHQRIENVFEGQLSPIPPEMREIKVIVERIKIQLQAAKFVGLVLDRMSRKEGKAFYAAVIRAILRNPESPRDELRSFGHLIDEQVKKAEMKFAMVGDRQDNDIESPTMLMGKEHILTIRLQSGKYSQEDRRALTKFPPRYVAQTLAQVKAILLSKDVWEAVRFKGDPPVFDWRVDFRDRRYVNSGSNDNFQIGIDFILFGIRYAESERSIISRVCAGVLVEDLLRSSSDFNTVISLAAAFPADADVDENCRSSRARILCALVDAGIGAGADLCEKTRQQLQEDERELAQYAPRTEPIVQRIRRSLVSLEEWETNFVRRE